ncbi:5-methylcytosine restriction system specificity protein McrC [Candidatus Avelusimicrobium fimicolum]|uniref:5-methylcytosine restriction system specificity protein McrC n=1 Tax=Candidatus Avelusimicrobium fimicolum TaxID=3416216 RepID=UPI003D110599
MALAILFDMNKLLEEFEVVALYKTLPGQVKIQNTRQIIKDIGRCPDTSYTIHLNILFCENAIIDTKYKHLSLPEDKRSEAGIYQMPAYNRFSHRRNIILCHPMAGEYCPRTTILETGN